MNYFYLILSTGIISSLNAEELLLNSAINTEFTRQEQVNSLESNRAQYRAFLENLAGLENAPTDWSIINMPASFKDRSVTEALNTLQLVILNTDDLELVQLLQRAVRNYNSLSNDNTVPFTTYYKHYQAPLFEIPFIDLTFDVQETYVEVTTRLTVQPKGKEDCLILDGRDQEVQHIQVNGQLVPRDQYKVTKHELILSHIPAGVFDLEIQSRIDPFHNETLEGMYLCQNWLTTQCESEGARRIFFTLDRPDVLSCITTTIIADKEKYPYRLSNGNLIEEKESADGRSRITWYDPFPKPSYLFACVLGDFSMLSSQYTTRSGLEVELQVYVEPGKEARAKYSLEALKKAMEFDEIFFDREYDLSCLKMVGIPDFNSGAMENKGLMIFNDVRLLVDSQSGTDGDFREVARVIAHEYFHNWSGNRVTVRNWFEIALKEAFTDWRAIKFGEWLFGEEFLRPKDVWSLKEYQFPEEYSENGHPIMVESYVDAHSIYDSTTYTKGREIFRTFEIYVNHYIPDGFREALNLYFSVNDGKAVTFRELLSAADQILARVNKDSSQFERWFHQPGTPLVEITMDYQPEEELVEFIVKQSCAHPKTGEMQKPFIIPFSVELFGQQGCISPKVEYMIDEEETRFQFHVKETPTPVFMHGFSAPVNLAYDYSLVDLERIMKYTDDAFNRWEAGQKYARQVMKEILAALKQGDKKEFFLNGYLNVYSEILKNPALTPLSKAQLLQCPSIRALSQAFNEYDFVKLAHVQDIFRERLALTCKASLEEIVGEKKAFKDYAPISDQMQLRELRNMCLSLLASIDEDYIAKLEQQYFEADNFNDAVVAFVGSINNKNSSQKQKIIEDFYHKWKEDKAVFNYWISTQAASSTCTVADLRRLEAVGGYERKNPNHIRSLARVFIANLSCYHDIEGAGYAYVVDKILEISQFNPMLAHNYLAEGAFQDFDHLPASQQALMARELERLKVGNCSPQTRDLAAKILKRYYQGLK